MTSQEVAKATNTGVANVADDVDGLEDMDTGDMTIPRIVIEHKAGYFKDNQTGETFTEFDCIMLGLVKQRSLWPPDPVDGEGPMCRSVDFATGTPDDGKWFAKHNGVSAQAQSGFTVDEVQAGNLDCSSCGNKEWKSHPNNGTPWCNEQFTFPVIRIMPDGTEAPALISFQKTGLKPCKAYASGFRQSKRPLYSAVTRISAVHNKKGTVEFVTPGFTRVSDSDQTNWAQYSQSLASIRDFITTPFSFDDETPVAAPSNNTNTAPAAPPAPAPAPAAAPAEAAPAPAAAAPARATPEPEPAAAPAPAASASELDEEEPF